MKRPGRFLEAAASPLAGVSAATFAGLSFLRRKRFFHPDGEVFTGTATILADAPFLEPGSFGCLVRFSRGVGLPEAMPDILGFALKIGDLGQDVLTATSGSGRVGRHVLAPANGFFRRPYSTVLPFDAGGSLVVLGAHADVSLEGEPDGSMDDLAAHVQAGRLLMQLTWAPVGTEEPTPLGSVVVDGTHEGDVSFHPFNVHPSLRPAGALNRLRRETYTSSQAARPDEG